MDKPHYRLTGEGPQYVPGGRPQRSATAHVAASGDNPDLRRWNPLPGSPDADLNSELGTIRSRSRDLERNHGVAHGVRQTEHDNVVGCGLRLSAKPNWRILKRDRDWAEEWGNEVEAWWETWWKTKKCDVTETNNGDGLTSLVYNSGFLNGEAVALPLWLPERGSRFSTCLQVIEPDRLCNPQFQPDTELLRAGIRYNKRGKKIAYCVRKNHPGDQWMGIGMGMGMGEWEEIPAEAPNGRVRVIHANVGATERPGQSRGKPALTAVLRQFKVLGDLTNAELKAAVANALVALVVESSLGQDQIVELFSSNPEALKTYQDGLANNKRSAIDYQGAMLLPVPLGTSVKSFSPGRPSNSFDAFVTTLFRLIGTGLNIPYELLMKDFSKTNYSSARAALLEAWRFFKGRRKWLADNWMTPVFKLFLEELVNGGYVDAPDFYENWEAYCKCKWIGDGRGWVDPLKEAQAADLRMDIFVSTLEDECAEQGLDWEEVLEQRAREEKKMKDLGLTRTPLARSSVATTGGEREENIPPGAAPGNQPNPSPASAGLAA